MSSHLRFRKRWAGIAALSVISACGDPNGKGPDEEDPRVVDPIGSAATLEIVTWNIEYFPKTAETVERVAAVLKNLDADVYCIQEISDKNAFTSLVASLEGYAGSVSSATTFLHLGVIYKTEFVTLTGMDDEPVDHSGFAARPPLRTDFQFSVPGKPAVPFTVLTLHLKCCGDGVIGVGEDDEEFRRQGASVALEEYLESSLDTSRVVVVGDWNDEIQEPQSSNVFWNFLADSLRYRFVDMPLALSSSYYWSYPGWPSHIDHILATDEWFGSMNDDTVRTLRLDDRIADYETVVSDHRPVAWVVAP